MVTIKGRSFRVDGCMRDLVVALNRIGVETLGCCCGHGKYPKTVIIKQDGCVMELFSGLILPRTRRFYSTDAAGYYYIPEQMRSGGR